MRHLMPNQAGYLFSVVALTNTQLTHGRGHNGQLVHKAGLEPARSEEHKHLKLACLPIPALVHIMDCKVEFLQFPHLRLTNLPLPLWSQSPY